ncbi:MAG: hypothetical protein FWF81_12660 [Defluviitaleaceae bacterium]|nr:hypothetical protein [Defluviitaleaceae bacterium]
MKANFTNLAGVQNTSENRREDGVFRKPLLSANRPSSGRRRNPVQERIAAQERELQLREMENNRIQQLNMEINNVQNMERAAADARNELIAELENQVPPNFTEIAELREANELGELRMNAMVERLSTQISQIHITRAEREQMAIEREVQRQQQDLEERMRERERVAQENRSSHKTDEELEREQERSTIRNLTIMSARRDNISNLSQTRARLSATATRLRGEADFELQRQRIANQEIVSFVTRNNQQIIDNARETGNPTGPLMQVGHLFDHNPLAPDGFRGQHLQRVESGIARLSAAMNAQVNALYRDSQRMQEEQLRLYRERLNAPENNENNDENDEYNPFDMRL